ncbi:MAG: DEAD/DEAH box helicase [Anaerolineae bacterium]|nr:DEAD/DEAH box helicase [Anaerolineae bacterium]
MEIGLIAKQREEGVANPTASEGLKTFSPGTVIRNRARLWRVDAQEGHVLVATSIDGGETEQTKFYIPFEDIQPGCLEPPSPDIVGHIQAQDLLLRAYRLSLLHGTAPLISLQRSRVIPKDYQLVPVVMALEMPRVRMLIADDVGLGKTIEAGLIITELLARQMATRVLVIVPANLREQWQEALDYFFHIPARIISTRHRREMERELPAGANPWEHYRFLITSVDYAKQPGVKNQILEQRWDIILIDEAHQVAKPHQSGPDQRVRMDRWELAKALAASPRVRHLLLLTATPHSGYTDSFASLLRMLDVGAVEGPLHQPHIIRTRAERHVCQRRREDVETWFEDNPASGRSARGRSPFPRRDQDEVIVPPTSYEMDAIRAVEAYARQVLQQASVGSIQARTLAHWTVMHLHKRALSSPEALRCSLRNRRERLKQRLAGAMSDEASDEASEETPIPPEVARATVLDEDPGERLTDEEAGQRTERVVYGTAEEIKQEIELLEDVMAKAEKVTPSRDSKLQKLLDSVLRELLRTDSKVVIFTRYVDTMNYLAEQIGRDAQYSHATVLTIHGGLNERQRREIFYKFERAKVGVLVATDAISEGINLQHAAAQVIHYELPWNPNRLEQRNGRVDRFGQRKEVVTIRTMVMDETLDATILKVLVEKAAQIRKDYGFSPPYFGDETSILDLLEQHEVLGPRQLSFLDGLPSPEIGRGGGGEGQNPFAEETLERIKGDSFYGQTHISLPEIEQRLEETAATVGSPEQIQAFVFSGLNRFGCSVTENGDRNGRLDGSWRIAIINSALQTASTGEVIERATFDSEWALDDPDVTLLDVGHPLVRRLIEEVKQNAFRADGAGDAIHYGRTAYVVTPDVDEVTALFHLLARYVVNTAPVSIVEELLPVAAPVYGDNPLPAEATRRLLGVRPGSEIRTDVEAREALVDALGAEGLRILLENAVETRRQELVAERRGMREQMEQREGAQTAEWLGGIDDLSPGSFDLLTTTILFPA